MKKILCLLLIFGGLLVFSVESQFLRTSIFYDPSLQKTRKEETTLNLVQDLQNSAYSKVEDCEVVVVGGGSGGFVASMQAARAGVKTCLLEETDWLGGMLTAAGVSAVDGGLDKSSGIFAEIITEIKNYYKENNQLEQTKLCAVSPFCFEPAVGARILNSMAEKQENLRVFYEVKVNKVYREGILIKGVKFEDSKGKNYVVPAKVTVDATEFGDLMHLGNVPYDLDYLPNQEESLSNVENACIQPLTYVAILKKSDKKSVIPRPPDYERENYRCTVKNPSCPDSKSYFDLYRHKNYGLMPNGKLMINTPSHSFGNDFHATAEELETKDRTSILQKAKNYTLGLIYFMQTELGFENYALHNEFESTDGLAKIPYVRESRRLKGVYRMKQNDVLPPNGIPKVFKDSIAIGDYPIDLHFCETGRGDIFQNVKPYTIPYWVTVPETIDGFLVAEKNISVSHIVNGTTRLQPVVMNIGQAVGLASALAVQKGVQPREISVKELQKGLLENGLKIIFFKDVPVNHYGYKYLAPKALEGKVNVYPKMEFYPGEAISPNHFLKLILGVLVIESGVIKVKEQINGEDAYALIFAEITGRQAADFLRLKARNLTRAEGAFALAKIFFENENFRTPEEAVNFLYEKGILKNKGASFRPKDFLNRIDATILLSRIAEKNQ